MKKTKTIFFITSYEEEMINKYQIKINEKEQNDYKSIKQEINKGNYVVFINEVEGILNENKKIEISIKIKEINDKYDKQKVNKYLIVIEPNENSCMFLFNYNLKIIEENINNIKSYFRHYFYYFYDKDRAYLINEKISKNQKFYFFYNYLLDNKSYNTETKAYYIELSKNFLDEIEKDKEKEEINIDTLLCILAPLHEINFSLKLNFKDLKIKFDFKNTNFIDKKDLFLTDFLLSLKKLNNKELKNKNEILELIMIYFIKFNINEIHFLFDEKENKEMIYNIFKLEKTTFLTEEILDETIIGIFINNCPKLEDILSILKKSNGYISYLETIKDNFEIIYKAITPLKSLKGLFNIDYNASLEDDSVKLLEIHNSIFDKQAKKNKYFINFIPIIDKYYDLYIKYSNLEGLCSLEKMTFEELKKFSSIKKIKDTNKKIISTIKELLKNKINSKNINGQDAIKILSKLRHHFNDETFELEQKKNILYFIIEKCKNDNEETMNEFKNQEIWELFKTKAEKEIYLDILKKQDFNSSNNFFNFFPEKFDESEGNTILSIINGIIEKKNEINSEDNENYNFFNKLFTKINIYKILLDYYKKKKISTSKILNIIIANIHKNQEKSLNLNINFIDDNYLKKNEFIIDNDSNELIPIYILKKIKENNKFIEAFIN